MAEMTPEQLKTANALSEKLRTAYQKATFLNDTVTDTALLRLQHGGAKQFSMPFSDGVVRALEDAIATQARGLIVHLRKLGVEPAQPPKHVERWLERLEPEPDRKPSREHMRRVLRGEWGAMRSNLLVHQSDQGKAEGDVGGATCNAILGITYDALDEVEIEEIIEHEQSCHTGGSNADGYIDWDEYPEDETSLD
jgi:hypothetical protein